MWSTTVKIPAPSATPHVAVDPVIPQIPTPIPADIVEWPIGANK